MLDLLLAEHLRVNSSKRLAPKHIIVRNKHKSNQYVLEMHHKQNKATDKQGKSLKDPKITSYSRTSTDAIYTIRDAS